MLHNDTASPGTETVISQTSFDIPLSSVPEAVDCGADLTAVSTSHVMKETALPLQVSSSQLAKQNAFVCKVIRNGSWFLYCIFSCNKFPI